MNDGPGTQAPRPKCRFSIIVPAHNAAETLEATVDSVRSQQEPDWELVIVENGSSDDTASVAQRLAHRDPRIRVLTSTKRGVGAARNLGLAAASGTWVLFLDADDWIDPSAMAKVTTILRDRPDLTGVQFDWWLQSVSGHLTRRAANDLADDGENLFELCARWCPVQPNTLVIRRDAVLAVGGFDESLAAAEDWDLWQRIGRTGATITRLKEPLAGYVLHESSAIHRNFVRLLTDSMLVIGRVHEPDTRVPHALAQHVAGADPSGSAATRLHTFLWIVALAIGAGAPIEPILDAFPNPGRGTIAPDHIVGQLYQTVPTGATRTYDEWPDVWPLVSEHLSQALAAFAHWDGDPALSGRVQRRLESLIVSRSDGRLVRAGETGSFVVDLECPLRAVDGEGATRLVGFVDRGGVRLGSIEVPVIGGRVTPGSLRDAIVDQLSPSIARRLVSEPDAVARLGIGAAKVAVQPGAWRAVANTRLRRGSGVRREVADLARWLAGASVAASPLLPGPVDDRHDVRPDQSDTRIRRATPPRRNSGRTTELPILMYHRIADTGPEPLAPFRVAVERFEEQLALLRQHDFTSISLDEWATSNREQRRVEGRRIAITFDDGYCDFIDNARPLLTKYGFDATVFVLPEQVGATSDWDADLGPSSPLMSWDDLRLLNADGFRVASHSLDHRHLTALTPDDVVSRERRARQRLAEELGTDITLIAYPYGDIDTVQRQSAAIAGYTVGVTTRFGRSRRFDHPMNLPRLDISGSTELDDFARLVGAAPWG